MFERECLWFEFSVDVSCLHIYHGCIDVVYKSG